MRRIFLVGTLLLFVLFANAKIIYVKVPAAGLNNGTSWLNSYSSLTVALTNAVAGDTIKVAQGTYKPGILPTNSFFSKSNVAILGGYASDSTITTRNWALYPTIISGEIGTSDLSDNIETLIVAANVNSGAVWDGFIVERSYRRAVAVSSNSQAVFRNVLFRRCSVLVGEGSVINSVSSSPSFVNCVFYQNTGMLSKGIIFAFDGSPGFTNCLFTKNANQDTASVMYFVQSSPLITNCTFFNNAAVSQDAKSVVTAKSNSAIRISNSIFFHNIFTSNLGDWHYTTDSSELNLSQSTAIITNSILQNYSPGTSIYSAENPRFRDTADVDGPDNIFFTADDGLQLTSPCSPGLNSGINNAVNGVTSDILGNPRIFNGGIVDLGPYELQATASTPLRVVYVKKTATGANDGSSWTNAFTDLQKALLYCADTVKVAADTYLPSSQLNPSIAFNLRNKMVVLGGYPNTGNPTDNDRNPQLNTTVLSGELGPGTKSFRMLNSKSNDSTSVLDGFVIKSVGEPNFFGVNRSASVFLIHNSSPVLKNLRITDNQQSPSVQCFFNCKPKFFDCVIDSNHFGLSIKYSAPVFKRCQFSYNGGRLMENDSSLTHIDSCFFFRNPGSLTYLNQSNGIVRNSRFVNNGGFSTAPDIYIDNSSPIIEKTYFTDSTLAEYGGAVQTFNRSAPIFTFCEFRNYTAQHSGGVMRNDNSSPSFVFCVFADNVTSERGGVVYNKNYSSPKFINCVIANNRATYGGFMYNERSFPEIISSTVSKNNLNVNNTNSVAAIYSQDSSRTVIKNSIFWGNFSTINSSTNIDFIDHNDGPFVPSVTTVSNSVTQVFGTNGVNGNFVGINPRMFEYNDADGLDNKFFTADDGMKLTACSPVINAGNNADITETTDILLNPRISGSSVDMGAYEYQNTPGGVPNVYYVNPSANGNNSGTSWANAYTDIWSAINNICADTIKVATGTYKPAINNRDSSYLIKHRRVYLGGYPATGNPSDAQRDPHQYPTILSGNIGNPADSTDNTRHVVFIEQADGKVEMDGFIIEKGQAENAGSILTIELSGGGILATSSLLTIRNCTLRNNYAPSKGGGAAFFDCPKLVLSGGIFHNNRVNGNGGGALSVRTTIGERSKVENSVFYNNHSNSRGGGIYIESNTSFYAEGIDLNNLLLYANNAEAGGGGVALFSPYKVSITNCNFIDNTCNPLSRGAGLYNVFNFAQDNGYPLVTNSLFKGNRFSTDENMVGSDIYDSNCPSLSCNRPNISYCRLQPFLGATGPGNISSIPVFVNVNDPDGPDNKWRTADDGFALVACSSLTEKGSNTAVTQISTDITGAQRIFNARVDIGAYESQGASVSIAASDTLICSGVTVTFAATPVNGGTNPSYQWQVNGVNTGNNSSTFTSTTLNNNDQVRVIMTSNETCLNGTTATSNIITIHTTTTASPTVTITSTQTSICSGTSVTFTAIPVNGGSSPAYQWQVNGINTGTNSNTFTSATLNNNDQVRVIMTSSLSCASPSAVPSNSIIISVTSTVMPAVLINTTATVICPNTSVSFIATPTNGGLSPTYQWKKNGVNVGSNTGIYITNSLVNGDIISVVMTSNATCASTTQATSNNITITVNNNVTPSVSISGNTSVMQGTSVVNTAAIVNGGNNPVYQWQDSTVTHNWQNITGANSNAINYMPLSTGDQIRCLLNSNAECASPVNVTSNHLVFTVIVDDPNNPGRDPNLGIVFYPNPVLTTFTLDSLKITDKWETLDIISLDGKKTIPTIDITNQSRVPINFSRFSSGVYMVILRRQQGVAYLKFVKQ